MRKASRAAATLQRRKRKAEDGRRRETVASGKKFFNPAWLGDYGGGMDLAHNRGLSWV